MNSSNTVSGWAMQKVCVCACVSEGRDSVGWIWIPRCQVENIGCVNAT